MVMGPSYSDQDFVITTEIGTPYHPNTFHRTYRKILDESDLAEFDFHALRHTHASILLQKGIHPKVVQEGLGHASVTMTLDVYSHLIPGMQETVVQAMEGLLS
jgi:integrase